MKKYISIITLSLLCANVIHAQSIVLPASPKSRTITGGYYTDTTNYQKKEIAKEYTIAPDAKIYIETGNRDINIKTWNEPTVKIVTAYFYRDSAEANHLTLDDIFARYNISVKSSDNAFQILASSPMGINFWQGGSNNFNFEPNGKVDIELKNFEFKPDSIKIEVNSDNLKSDSNSFNKMKLNTLKFHLLELTDSLHRNITVKMKKITEDKNQLGNEKRKKELGILQMKFAQINEKIAQLDLINLQQINEKKLAQLNKESLELAAQARLEADKALSLSRVQESNAKELQNRALKMAEKVRSATVIVFTPQEIKRHWDIYIPAGHALEIENKSGNIHIENDMDNVKIISESGNIEVPNVGTLNIRSKFGNIHSRNIQKAIVTLEYGKFTSGDIQDLKIDSKFSNIDLNKVKNINIVSSNDDYDIDEAGKINAEKKYGTLRIVSMKDSFSLNGANADIKLRNISPDASFIKIDNKYADIRLSLDNIKNYSLRSTGSFNTVYADFEKTPIKQSDNTTVSTSEATKDNGNFTAVGGTGAGTKIEINCTSCRLGF